MPSVIEENAKNACEYNGVAKHKQTCRGRSKSIKIASTCIAHLFPAMLGYLKIRLCTLLLES